VTDERAPQQFDQRGRLPRAMVAASLRSPGIVFALWALVLAASVPGLMRVRVDTSTDSVLDRGHPAWTFYEYSQELFGGDETLVVALEGERPFDPALLREVARLTPLFEQLPGVRRVDSIATVPIVRVQEDGVLDLDAALFGAPEAASELSKHVSIRLEHDRIAPRSLISEDGRVFAVNIILEQGSESGHEALLAEVYSLAGPKARVSGVPVFRVETNGRTRSEILFFSPLTGLLLAVFLWVTFRRARAILLCLLPGVLGAWLMLAAMGALEAPLTITTMILPSIVLALGAAYSMHVMVAGAALRGRDQLRPALLAVALPVALSGLTTGVGFLAVALVGIEAVRFVGVFGSVGVLAVTAAALSFVPALLCYLPLEARPPLGSQWIRRALASWLLQLAQQRRAVLIVAWCILLGASGYGATRVDVDTDATQWLPRGNPVRDAYESIRRQLSGISPVNVVIETEGSVLEPPTLVAIDALSRYLERLPDVGKAISIADPLRQIHGGFTDDPRQPLPEGRNLAEQYLLLLESVEQIGDLLTDDRTGANILLRVDHNGSSHLLNVAAEAEEWWAQHGPSGATSRPTGIMYEYARAEDEIAMGQLRGLSFALLVILGVLLAIFRSFRLAAVALVPNAIPLTMIFGLMGFLRVPLDAGTVLVGSLALGVAVDDTIHLTSRFYERVEAGDESLDALRSALVRVLSALVFTTVMISVAFVVLGFSEFTFTRNLGLLTAAIMVLCLLADTTLLPALLLSRRSWRRGSPTEGSNPLAGVRPSS
jgi:predicted RND superfamily exporter protein